MATTTRQVSPSLVKIQPEEYVDTPSSSTTVSPAESCANDVAKQSKPWERTESIASSVDSSETSDPLSEEDVEPHGDAEEEEDEEEESVVVKKSAKTDTQALKMQTHLRGMQRRLETLQRLMQEAAQQDRLRAHSQETTAETSSCLEASADGGEAADSQRHATLALKERVQEPLELTSASPSRCEEGTPNDDSSDIRDDQADSSSSSSGEEGPPAITTLLNRIKSLQAQLKEATDENQQLQNTVHRLEQENARFQAQTALNPSKSCDADCGPIALRHKHESSAAEGDEIGEDHDKGISCLTTAIFRDPSAFQRVMEEDLAVLKDHERCQHKLHELWNSVRTLKTFVETYEIERNAMKIQRDDAIAEAERADAENVKLASSSNPQQKIKYLQQVKKDNQALRRKNRALNVRIAKQAAKLIREKNGCSLLEDGDTTIDTVGSATLDDTLQEFDEPSVHTGEEILRSMRGLSGVLEQRLERMRLARQDLPEDDGDSSGEASESERQTAVPVIGQPTPATSVSVDVISGAARIARGCQS